MAFLQPSIVDILTLSEMAFDIAQTFTSGRKSAPAEFHEVQNQLYSLSKALDSFKSLALDTQQQGDQAEGIIEIVGNCCFTLEHLQHLVDKYMVIQEQDGKPRLHRMEWRAEIWRNWKKIRWTREGGDLARRQHNLGVHINSLNLAVAVMNSESNQKVGHQVDDVRGMLCEIHEWFTRELKVSEMKLSQSVKLLLFPPTGSKTLGANQPLKSSRANVEVYTALSYHTTPVRKLVIEFLQSVDTMDSVTDESDRAVRRAANSVETMVVLTKIVDVGLSIFEREINQLAIMVARQSVERRIESLVVFPYMNPYSGHPVISVVSMICDTRRIYGKVGSVELIANRHRYSPGSVEAIQLIHYKHLTSKGEWLYQGSTEIILQIITEDETIGAQDDRVTELTVTLDQDTDIGTSEGSTTLTIAKTSCTLTSESGQELVEAVDVQMVLLDRDSARYLHGQLRSLQGGVVLFKIQQIQRSEMLIFELVLGYVMIYNYHISDATLKLIDVLSIDVSAESLRDIDRRNDAYIEIGGLCLVVEIAWSRVNIHQHDSTVTLTCADQETQKMLVMMLQSAGRDVDENGGSNTTSHGLRKLEESSMMGSY
ncbi:hypothetical protein ASPCADRAFT_131285 [Aspergillus carbonarius ITEM 5010]|uniref:NACHT-NTPase and P-loop NTPases N-terminal domain-containing protein n=1 Tax=Aspergillus carbonarius (strain ITEM 5010) TaxID=602072 RepID=A0A1R3RJL4_ASPC5|nr:hypothetical protein ASPCADRAFT_131285 [Aspergillus carbonarius ITEM 5010]